MTLIHWVLWPSWNKKKSTKAMILLFMSPGNKLKKSKLLLMNSVSYFFWDTRPVVEWQNARVRCLRQWVCHQSDSRFSRILKIFFLHFHFSFSISSHFNFTFNSRKRVKGIYFSLFTSRKKWKLSEFHSFFSRKIVKSGAGYDLTSLYLPKFYFFKMWFFSNLNFTYAPVPPIPACDYK